MDPRWKVCGKGASKTVVDALEKVRAKQAARKEPAASTPSNASEPASPDLEDFISDTPPAPPGTEDTQLAAALTVALGPADTEAQPKVVTSAPEWCGLWANKLKPFSRPLWGVPRKTRFVPPSLVGLRHLPTGVRPWGASS